MKLIILKNKYNIKSQFNVIKKLKTNPISNKFHRITIGTKKISNKDIQTIMGYRYLYRHRFDLVDKVRKNGSVELFSIKLKKIELVKQRA